MSAQFQLTKSTSGKYHFNLKAGNGEVILSSETYETKPAAQNGIQSVKANAPLNERYERKTSVKNEPYFVLKAANHEPIGRSEMYSSTAAMENGLESVQRNAPGAGTDDQTGQ